jgi:DNA (cytosine-5)-methyltransferase 1
MKRWLDLYCCQGGSSHGFHRAGFSVTGVDITPQPKYKYTFYLGDAIQFVRERRDWIRKHFAGVSASPPCQKYSITQKLQGNEHPDLIAPTREVLEDLGLPYVIENVEEARSELINPVLLCGGMEGFRINTYRHRLFEIKGFEFTPPEHPKHEIRQTKMGRPRIAGEYGHFVGNFSGVKDAQYSMGMLWANRDGIREAVPPAYTELLGRAFMEQLA